MFPDFDAARVLAGRRQFRHRPGRGPGFFAARGAQVTIASRHQARLDAALASLSSLGRPMPVPARASPARCSTSPTTQPWPPSSPRPSPGTMSSSPPPRPRLAGAPAATGRCLRRARQQVLGRLPRGARGADPRARIAHAGVGLPRHPPEQGLGAAGRDQRGAGCARARAGAGAVAGARQHGLARPDRHTAVGQARSGRAPGHVRRRRRAAAGAMPGAAGRRRQCHPVPAGTPM